MTFYRRHVRALTSYVYNTTYTHVYNCRWESTHDCRLCRAVVPAKRSTSLFIPLGLQQKWASRIEDLFDVSAAHNDGLPVYICDIFKRRLVLLGMAAVDLTNFREQARKFSVVASRGLLKRTKDTSGSAVSPYIMNAIPQPKRLSSLVKRLDFGESSITDGKFATFINSQATITTRQLIYMYQQLRLRLNDCTHLLT